MVIKRVSPTQISAFRACPMSWYYGWVLKRKSPPTESQARGSDIHQHAEDYMEGKITLDDIKNGKHYLASLIAAIQDGHVPLVADNPGLLVEQHAGTMVFDGTVTANGKIDLTFPWPEDTSQPLVIRDWKSCKSFNYAKSPTALAQDDQCIFYANEMVARGWTGPIIFQHFYLRTNSSEYKLVETEPLTQEYLRSKFLDMERTVCEMKAIASKQIAEVTKDKTACRNYGGCYHLDPCSRVVFLKPGVGIMSGLNLAGTRGNKASTPGKISPLAAKLNAKKAAAPPPPTRFERMSDALASAVALLTGVVWEDVDVEATQATFDEDVYALAFEAMASNSIEDVLRPIEDDIKGLQTADFNAMVEGVGEIIYLTPQETPQETGDINPPDASPNFHPAPGEEPLSELGLDGRAAKPLARAGVNTMAELIAVLAEGTDLVDLDGVGATAAAKAQRLAIDHLLSDRGANAPNMTGDLTSDAALLAQLDEANEAAASFQAQLQEVQSRQTTQFDPNEEAQARIAELERLLQDEEGCRAKACAEAEGLRSGFTLYVGCHVEGAVPVQTVLNECVGDDIADLYSAAYDDGKKSVAASFLNNLQTVIDTYPEISFARAGGGMFSSVIFEVLAPHATRIVRGS